ncbi:hypothetical protein CW304_01415 [Bacillus sp. UFRGS-B20]|nr:hypothetical protein CW304_01415 [Bacillus sp. UFRGS-B20]
MKRPRFTVYPLLFCFKEIDYCFIGKELCRLFVSTLPGQFVYNGWNDNRIGKFAAYLFLCVSSQLVNHAKCTSFFIKVAPFYNKKRSFMYSK